MKRDGQATKQKILKVAEELFAEKGFDATSVDSIARTAGVNKALIYYYFKSKNDLVSALFISIIQELGVHLRAPAVVSRTQSGEIDLRDKIKQEILFLDGRRKILSVLLMEALKQGRREGFLFKCAEMVISHEAEVYQASLAAKKAALSDPQAFQVFEFFTGFMPLLAFVVFREKWCRHFKSDPETLLSLFLDSFQMTHLAAQQGHNRK